MSSPDSPDLAGLIGEVIDFARSVGCELGDIGPDDFALQRSPAGWSHATWVGPEHVLSVTIDPDGVSWTNVGEIDWIDQDAEYEEPEGDDMLRVYLPGDPHTEGPAATAEQLEAALHVVVVRDANGAIRRRDGTYVADADTTIEQLHAKIGAHVGSDSARALYLVESYMLAIDLITREQAAIRTLEAMSATAIEIAEAVRING